MAARMFVAVVISSVLGTTAFSWPGPCNNKSQWSRCNPEIAIKKLADEAEGIFVGTLTAVEPARPVEWRKESGSGTFGQTNQVTFAVESTLKGEKMETLKTKGSDLVLLYNDTEKFLVFLHKEDKDGFRFYPPHDIFEIFNATSSPDWHWEIGVHGGKRLPPEYEPYVLRFDMNSSLWLAGDTARWPTTLRKDVEKELVAIDPQFSDTKKLNEVFSLTIRGCHWIKDEWDRPPINGVGYIGWTPCPLPLAFVKAYIKVLVRQ
ncbi:MAG: hypothetical protein CEO12_447 [Parcubacteria group bacterium Gr01-1014_46]|nr:MAG: hypothetical protein CEO12_447 [Parcubacteria group bacterium Gr01-1014_46]